MKLIYNILVIGALLLTSLNVGYASNSYGSAVVAVSDSSLSAANQKALSDALINSVKNYVKDNSIENKVDINNIDNSYIKFIKSYVITNRRVYIANNTTGKIEPLYEADSDGRYLTQNYLPKDSLVNNTKLKHYVAYSVTANIDDEALQHIFIYLQQSLNQLIFSYSLSINGNRSNTVDSFLDRELHSNLIENELPIDRQRGFYANLINTTNLSEVYTSFRGSSNSNLIFFNYSMNIEDTVIPSCSIIISTYIYSKSVQYPIINLTDTLSHSDASICLQKLITSSTDTIVEYIATNYLQSIKTVKIESYAYDIILLNEPKQAIIKDLVNYLQNRQYLDSYNFKSYSFNNISYSVNSYLRLDELANVVSSSLKDAESYDVITRENSVVIIKREEEVLEPQEQIIIEY